MFILVSSVKKASNVWVPALGLLYIYAAVGLYSFSGTCSCYLDLEYSKCRDPANKERTANWTVYEDRILLCGQKPCPVVNGTQYECLNPIFYGVEPNPNELMNMVQGYGVMNYQNMGFSLFSTFKQILLTGSSRLIVLYKQVLHRVYVELYFYTFIYFMYLCLYAGPTST